MREPYIQWAQGNIDRVKNILSSARAEHTDAVKERITSVSEMKDVVSITEGLFAISKVWALFKNLDYALTPFPGNGQAGIRDLIVFR